MEKLRDEIAAQQDQLFLWAAVFLCAGIGLYFSLLQEPPAGAGLGALGAGTAAFIITRNSQAMRSVIILLLFFFVGFSAAQLRTAALHQPMINKQLGPVEVSGTIETIETLEAGKGARILLHNLTIEKLPSTETPRRVRLTTRKPQEFAPGQRVTVLAQLNPPSPPVAPGAFDFQRYMYFEGIGAVGFIYKNLDAEINSLDSSHKEISSIENLRNAIATRMRAVIDPRSASMAIAFTTGQRTAIPDDDNTAMRNSGLFHLVSISGLHIGLFSALIFFSVRLLLALVPGMALKYPIKKYAAVFGFLAATFYTVLAGASIPTQRSLIMVGIVYLAIMIDRSPISLRMAAVAAMIILLIWPEGLISASFQMSFAAIICLILFYDAMRPWIMEWHREAGRMMKIGLYMAGVCVTTLVATVATAPFSLFHFQNLALYGLIGNALAVPLTSFIVMPAIVLALILMPFHLEYLPLKVLEWGITILLDIAYSISSLPHAVLHVTAWPIAALASLVAGFIFYALWDGAFRFAGLIPVMIAFAIIYTSQTPDILVSQKFDLAAYKDETGALHVLSKRKNKFSAESWEQMARLPKGSSQPWPKEGSNGGAMTCDDNACRLELKGKKFSFLKKSLAIPEECEWADTIISFQVLDDTSCNKATVFDKLDGYRNGAHAFWLDTKKLKVKSVNETRGKRPWSKL